MWVNDHIPIISEMPHGGYRHSGFGKDMSAYGFDEYTNVKHVMHDNTAVAEKPWHRTIFTSPADSRSNAVCRHSSRRCRAAPAPEATSAPTCPPLG